MGDDKQAPVMMAPGEHRIRKEGGAEEVIKPWQQYVRLMMALAVVFGSGSVVLWILGKWSLYLAGWLGVLGLLVASQYVGERLTGPRVVATLTAVTVGGFWAISGLQACESAWIFATPGWPGMVKAWVIGGILLVVTGPAAWVAYRYAVEIVDPSGPTPPRKASERLTPIMPWTAEEKEEHGLGRDEMREMMREMLQQVPRDTVRVEIVEGGDGNGNLHTGATITANDFPVGLERMRALARRMDDGRYRWSRRDVAGVPGIGEDKARQLLEMMVERKFLEYANGQNHPEGGSLTAKGRALMRGLLS